MNSVSGISTLRKPRRGWIGVRKKSGKSTGPLLRRTVPINADRRRLVAGRCRVGKRQLGNAQRRGWSKRFGMKGQHRGGRGPAHVRNQKKHRQYHRKINGQRPTREKTCLMHSQNKRNQIAEA